MSATAQKKTGKELAMPDWNKPTNQGGLERLGQAIVGQVDKGLPKFLQGQAQRLIRCMITECSKTPALLDCTPISLFSAVIQAGQCGLTIGGQLGEAYLIPFKKQAQLIIGYKGYVQLAHRSGQILTLQPRVVHEADEFEVKYGLYPDIIHKPAFGKRGNVIGYYVIVQLVNGGRDFECMTVEEAIEHRNRYAMSKNSGPWSKISSDGVTTPDFDGMALKTLIRKLAKRLPLSAEWQMAASLDEQAEQQIMQDIPRFQLPEATDTGPSPEELEQELQQAAGEQPAKGEMFPGQSNGNASEAINH